MSTKHTKKKQSKGKQKIEMKKVEGYGDRMITFSKRKSGIFKKMVEIITMCDVETAFLVYSQAGRPFTFAYPSMEDVASRFMDPLRHEMVVKDEAAPILEAYKKRKIEELIKKSEDLEEEVEMEEEKLKKVKDLWIEKKLGNMWWNIPEQGLSKEDLKQRHEAFVELYENLCDLAISGVEEHGGGSGSCSGNVGGPSGAGEA